MGFTLTKKLLFSTLTLLPLANSLPGRQFPLVGHCRNGIDIIHGLPCGDTQPTSSSQLMAALTTPAPVPLRKRAVEDADQISLSCDSVSCVVLDVTVTTLSAFPASEATNSNFCWGPGCSTRSVSLLTTGGTGTSSSSSLTTFLSPAPFANASDTSLGAPGPTAGLTASSNVSATETSTNTNSTLTVHSTVTRSVTTHTDSPWTAWMSRAAGTGAAASSGASPVTTSCSNNSTCSNNTSAGAESTSMTRSFVSTATYPFEGTTVTIPVPGSWGSTLPAPNNTVPSTTSSTSQVISATTTSLDETLSGSTLFNKCYTTTALQPSSVASDSTAVPESSLICWGFSCVDHTCTDSLTRVPLVKAVATTVTSDQPSASPVLTDSIWPSNTDGATRNPAAYTSLSTKSSDAADAFVATTIYTYITDAEGHVLPLPVATTSVPADPQSTDTSTTDTAKTSASIDGPDIDADVDDEISDNANSKSGIALDMNNGQLKDAAYRRHAEFKAARVARMHKREQEVRLRRNQKLDTMLAKKAPELQGVKLHDAVASSGDCCRGVLSCLFRRSEC